MQVIPRDRSKKYPKGRRFRYTVEAGANFSMTQPVYQPALLVRFLERIADCRIPVLVGILPLASHRNAEFLHNEVPGMSIPKEYRDRMATVGSGPKARAVGVSIAQEALEAVNRRSLSTQPGDKGLLPLQQDTLGDRYHD